MTELDAAFAVAWMHAAATRLEAAVPLLTELDAARGDADHGVNMQRGFAAIAQRLEEAPPADAEAALLEASKVLRRTVGGTSGPLWSVALRRAGKALGAGEPLGDALAAAAAGVGEIGGAQEGDNTMLDALLPAARALRAEHGSLREGVEAAAEAADAGAASTADRVATKGRASYLGERGVGSPDPGAASAAIVVRALLDAVA
jgi:phosphoenolpyruvate---glycerone phosphotransferase subunit DhaL